MKDVHPRTPVFVGIVQKTVRPCEQPAPEPLACWQTVCRAAADAGIDAATPGVEGGFDQMFQKSPQLHPDLIPTRVAGEYRPGSRSI